MWWFTLIKYFLTTVLMKNSAAKLDHTRYHRTGSRPPVPEGSGVVTEGGIRALPLAQAKEVFR
ncbi:hypothetical protein HanRHA438_Chr13g0581441 [Helianthus annuus]|nr:hypothetical protein HanRHA438_Chr13g0581441 [Helianthus annuus]